MTAKYDLRTLEMVWAWSEAESASIPEHRKYDVWTEARQAQLAALRVMLRKHIGERSIKRHAAKARKG